MTGPGLVKEITSPANPIIKQIRGLSQKKNREADGLFMAEGLKLVTDALAANWEIQTLVFAKQMQTQPHLQTIAAAVRARGGNILIVSDKVLTAISRRENPQTVIGIFHQRWHSISEISALLEGPGDVVVALDRIRDPGNLGTIIRTADAAGIRGIILIGETTDPFSLEATRATMGSIFQIPMGRTSEPDFIAWAQTFEGRIAGTHLKGGIDYRQVAWNEKHCVIVMGTEQQGMGDALANACDDLVIIPMAGLADSLNLAIATGVVIFEARRTNLTLKTMNREDSV